MKRTFSVVALLLVLLVCFAFNFSTRNALTPKASAATNPEASEFRAEGPSLKIVFRGLMVFHSDQARQYFEVGILKAPEHEFRVQVLENSPDGVSSFSLPLEQTGPDVWSLEFPRPTSGVSFYQNGSFDRKSGVGDEKDFRWLVDLRSKEFYDHELQADSDQLGIVLRLSSGKFYTNKRTPPLMRKKGNSAFEYFGWAAQEVATDVFLGEGDMVLKSEKAGTELLRLKQKPDSTYEIIIENAPIPQEHMISSANHFQYYYQLLGIPKDEWYDFKPLIRAMTSRSTDSLRTNLVRANYVKTDEIPCMPIVLGP